jgi:hypothetical protein
MRGQGLSTKFVNKVCQPPTEVRLSNEPSETLSLTHQAKQTPHETRYARRPRAEMCPSVRVRDPC